MSISRFTRRGASALSVLLLGLALAGGARAAAIYPSFTPAVLSGSAPWTTTYSIELDTGAVPERFDFQGPGRVSLQGPGTLSASDVQVGSATRTCARGRGATVPGTYAYGYYHLDLPAWTSNLIVAEVVRSQPLAVGEDLGYQFSIGASSADWKPSDAPAAMSPIDVGEPQMVAARSVPLTLSTALTSASFAPAHVARGKAIPLRGSVTPLLAGHLLELRYTTVWPASWQRVARVRVGSDGTYAARWVPPAPGLYTFSVSFHSHDPRFLSGSGPVGCMPTVQVMRPR